MRGLDVRARVLDNKDGRKLTLRAWIECESVVTAEADVVVVGARASQQAGKAHSHSRSASPML